MNLPRPRPLNHHVIILTSYFLLTLALTYPLAANLTTHIPGHVTDGPAQTWSIWWVQYAIFTLGANPLYSDYLFYPLGMNLVAYTPTFLNGVLSIPLQFTLGVIPAQNLIVFFALAVGGYGAFLLTREILARNKIHSDFAAALAGAFYAVGAWHVNYVVAGHFMLLSNEWLPFYTLYLIRLDKPPWRNGALAGLFLVLTAWTELTFVPFLAILTALYLLWFTVTGRGLARVNADSRNRSTSIRVQLRPLFLNLAALGVIAVIGISPLALNLLADTLRYGYYLTSGVGRIYIFSAEPLSFFIPSAQHPLLGAWANSVNPANTSYAFIGYAALLLAALGFYFYRAAADARWGASLALLFALLMLGSTLVLGNQPTAIPMPFAALRAIPFVNANRYPVRFNVMLMLALTPLLAFGAARLRKTRRGSIALAGLLPLLILEQLVLPIPLTELRVPAIFETMRAEPGDFAVLDLPLGWRSSIVLQGKQDDKAEFYQTVHHKRLLGGITSRVPSFKFQYFLEAPVINSLIALETGREVDAARRARDRAAASAVLRFFNIRYVNVNRALTAPPLLEYAREVLPLTEIYRDDARSIYRVAAPAPAPAKIALDDETARLYFDDAWGRAQAAPDGAVYRWATRAESVMWLPLTRADHVITFRLRAPRAAQKIGLRVNGQPIADWDASPQWSDVAVGVPAAVLREGLNEFVFVTETTPIPTLPLDDYTVGATGAVSPVDIAATGAGFDAGRFGEIWVAGRNVIPNQRGYHLVALDPRTGEIDAVAAFDTFGDVGASRRLAQFVARLPRGEIVAGVGVDDVSQALAETAVQALNAIGVAEDLRAQFRTGHAFIGVKGARPGEALEHADARLPANVAVGKDASSDRVAFALGGVEVR